MEQLYFIAIVPPAGIQDEITALKQEIAEKYGSSHALKSPPHITLHMPFRWKEKRFEELNTLMLELNEGIEPFEIELQNFDFFEPRVVFVDVMENEDLTDLQKQVVDACRRKLKLDHANYRNRAFHPHVTIGFRDLKKAKFYEAKKEFEERVFANKFRVQQVELLQHDGKQWHRVECN